MQIKPWHRFYFKIFLCFWIFCILFLISISFIAGQIKISAWMSPREKAFINSYAVIMIKSLSSVRDKRAYICDIDKHLNNNFVIVSKKEVISCQNEPLDVSELFKTNNNNAFTFKTRIVSDAIPIDGLKYRLLSQRDQPLYKTFVNKNVGYRLIIVFAISAFLCFFISKYLTWPLKIVIKKMSNFSHGNLNARVGNMLKQRKDEFTEIGYEFDKMANSIQDLIKSKQHMLYNISHELRSPLARQLMTLDVMKVTPCEKHELLLDKIEKDNKVLNERISEILMLAKLSTRTFSYHPKKENISDIIKNSADNINYEFNTNVIKVHSALKIQAEIDKKLMTMVIENLLKNSLKYSGIESEIKISVNKKSEKIEIKIADQGPGIPEEDLPFIFEPFKQSKNKNKIHASDNGYGLGLAIAQEIVKLHNGTIKAQNNQPNGLIISINLPA